MFVVFAFLGKDDAVIGILHREVRSLRLRVSMLPLRVREAIDVLSLFLISKTSADELRSWQALGKYGQRTSSGVKKQRSIYFTKKINFQYEIGLRKEKVAIGVEMTSVSCRICPKKSGI
ncbi:hypothetical protein AB6A40_007819 [Gnathostoma spinigerum]|uniref:Uncharacterized protein n=1 Tax=Gnathostoma spinigerum TaxID=75299 RepID=A0ABD6EMD0_9BILA